MKTALYGRIVFGASAVLFGVIALLWHDADTWQNLQHIWSLPFGTIIGGCLMEAILKRVHPDDKAMVQAQISHATSQGKDCNLEYRLLLPDDSVKYVHVVAHVVKDKAGNLEFVGAVTDITERKAAEERIRGQEAELQQMLNFAPQLIAVLGPNRERLYINRIALDYLGLSLEEWQQTLSEI